MTKDIISTIGEQESPSKDATSNQFQQFCVQAEKAEGAALLDVIKQMLEAPGIYVFGELLVMPNVQELQNGPHAKYYNSLNLFAYGNFNQYKQAPNQYLDLSPSMQKKLMHLTIISLAVNYKSIPYEMLLKELEISNVRMLEDCIIEAIYADILHGRLDHEGRFLQVDYAQGRDIPPDCTGKITKTLENWVESCKAVSGCIEEQITRANSEKLKKLKNKERIENEITNLKRILKNQVNDTDDAMQIDGRDSASTSHDTRKKTCKVRATRSSAANLKFNK